MDVVGGPYTGCRGTLQGRDDDERPTPIARS